MDSLIFVSPDLAEHNQELLEAIHKIGEAATKLMDFETYKAFSSIQKRIVSAAKSAKMDNKQMSSAMDLVLSISRQMEEGKIRLRHIKYFIDLSQSGKLSKLLSTWDKELLKKP